MDIKVRKNVDSLKDGVEVEHRMQKWNEKVASLNLWSFVKSDI